MSGSNLGSRPQGHPTPYWLWVAQRISAVLLGPLVLAHITVPGAPFMGWLGLLLLAVVLVHVFSGLWRLAAMNGVSHAVYRAGYTLSVVVTLALAALGVVVVASLL
jgi:succinate dehydrogenase hydrophobic anchor subunit